jgi:hypothetical protein
VGPRPEVGTYDRWPLSIALTQADRYRSINLSSRTHSPVKGHCVNDCNAPCRGWFPAVSTPLL